MNTDSELKRLRDSEEKYRLMIEEAGDAIFTIDTADGSVLEVNRMAEEVTGLNRSSLVGRKVWDLHPEHERDLARELFEKVASTGRGSCHELHLLRADGSSIVMDIAATVICHGGKSIIQRICRDVTNRRRLEKQNKHLKEYFEHILNMMPVGLGVLKEIASSPAVEFENRTLKQMFACCEEEKLDWRWNSGADHTDILLDESGEYVEERTLPNKRTYQFKTSYFRDQGDSWKEMHVIQDVTWRRKLEDELRTTNENLEVRVQERTRELAEKQFALTQAEKMAALGNLVAGIAHEINTPLGALKSNNDVFSRYVEKLKALLGHSGGGTTDRHDPQIGAIFTDIEQLTGINADAASRIVNIVTSLRKFARLDQAEKDRVDIHDGIDSTLTLVNHQLKDRINVVKEYAELPKVSCYPNQLNQVFMNVLVNASQAIVGKGEIRIRTIRQGDNVIVEFCDNGPGMPADVVDHIFEPGFTTKQRGIGTGLGLSIVKQIVDGHNGRIEVDSEQGKGTTFRITLPID